MTKDFFHLEMKRLKSGYDQRNDLLSISQKDFQEKCPHLYQHTIDIKEEG